MFAAIRSKSLIINQIIVLLVLLMLTGIGFIAIRDMKDSADRMGQGKDVVADILPPPLYMLESQLVVSDLLTASPADRQPFIDKLASLKKDYDTRNTYWETSNLDKQLLATLMGDQRK